MLLEFYQHSAVVLDIELVQLSSSSAQFKVFFFDLGTWVLLLKFGNVCSKNKLSRKQIEIAPAYLINTVAVFPHLCHELPFGQSHDLIALF